MAILIPKWKRYKTELPKGPVEIDWSHIVAENLASLIIPSRRIEAVNYSDLTFLASPVFVDENEPVGFNLTSKTEIDGIDGNWHNLVTKNNGAFGAVWTPYTNAADQYIMSMRYTGTNSRMYLIDYSNAVQFGWASSFNLSTTGTWVVGKQNSIILSWSAANSATCYFGGASVGTSSLTNTDSPDSSAIGVASSAKTNSTYSAQGYCPIAFVWSNYISNDVAESIEDSPFEILKPYNRRVYFYTSGGVTLTLANLSQSQTLGVVDLTQQNTLAMNGLAQSQALDNVSLTQQNTISVANLNQEQTLSNIDLVQQNLLSMANLLQSQTIGNVDLVQQNTISVDGISQSQSLGNIDLTQQNTLAVSTLSQSQALENVVLSSGLTLSVNALSQSQSLDNLSLVQQNVLSIGNLAQNQTLDAIGLTQANILTVNSLVHSQALGAITLDFSVALSVDSILEAQALDNIALTQANILSVYSLSQGQTLQQVALSQQSTLVVNNLLHQQLLSSATLIDGSIPLLISGDVVFVLKSDNGPVFVVNSHSNVFVKGDLNTTFVNN